MIAVAQELESISPTAVEIQVAVTTPKTSVKRGIITEFAIEPALDMQSNNASASESVCLLCYFQYPNTYSQSKCERHT